MNFNFRKYVEIKKKFEKHCELQKSNGKWSFLSIQHFNTSENFKNQKFPEIYDPKIFWRACFSTEFFYFMVFNKLKRLESSCYVSWPQAIDLHPVVTKFDPNLLWILEKDVRWLKALTSECLLTSKLFRIIIDACTQIAKYTKCYSELTIKLGDNLLMFES